MEEEGQGGDIQAREPKMPSQAMDEGATHRAPRPWVGEGDLRKLRGQGFNLPPSS